MANHVRLKLVCPSSLWPLAGDAPSLATPTYGCPPTVQHCGDTGRGFSYQPAIRQLLLSLRSKRPLSTQPVAWSIGTSLTADHFGFGFLILKTYDGRIALFPLGSTGVYVGAWVEGLISLLLVGILSVADFCNGRVLAQGIRSPYTILYIRSNLPDSRSITNNSFGQQYVRPRSCYLPFLHNCHWHGFTSCW